MLYLLVQHIPWDVDYISGEASLWAYSSFALVLLLALSAHVLFVEKILWRKLAVVTAIILLLPQISFDYRQLFLYLPIYYFVNDRSNFKRNQDGFYVSLFGVLLIPKNYYLIYGDVSISDSLTVILLLTLTLTIIMSGFKQRTLAN